MMFVILLLIQLAFSQELSTEKVSLTFDEGLAFRKDNDFLMRLRFRVQNRFTAITKDEKIDQFESTEFSVRRMRLRFDGYALDPRLLYRVQFAFTRWDQDWDNTQEPNILRDAVVGWRWQKNHTLWVGIAKLPGNRQRVVSSSAQQLVDRSIVNARFAIDRDMGVQHYSKFWEERPFWLKLALSNGEGRNQPNQNASLASTIRMEWYPLGAFHDDGDTIDADLFRESEPRIGIGLVNSSNQSTGRAGGQTGQELGENEFRSMETKFVDMIFKYRGFSLSGEYAKRTSGNPIVTPKLFVYAGEGYNLQTGYVFESNWEPSVRYSQVIAASDIRQIAQDTKQYTVGLSRYIKYHVVKVQTDLTYQDSPKQWTLPENHQWILRFQVELGI